MSYVDIFWKNLQKHGMNFEQAVIESFSTANEIDERNGIDEMFVLLLMQNSYTVEQINIMIQHGADISRNNFAAFGYMLHCTDPDVLRYFLDKYHYDVNLIKNLGPYTSDKIFQLFVEKGLNVNTESIYRIIICVVCEKKFKILIENGINMSDLVDVYLDGYNTPSYTHFAVLVIEKITTDNDMYGICNEKLNKLLVNSICFISKNVIKQIFSMGVDPRYMNNIYLSKICTYIDADQLSEFIDDYGWDIHSVETDLLSDVIYACKLDVAKLFLDRGIKITERAMIASFCNEKCLNFLLQHNPDIQYFSKLFIHDVCKNSNRLGIFKMFIKNGVDMNQVIMDC